MLIFLSTLISCKVENKPSQPQLIYDETSATIQFKQTDALAKDTAIITIGSLVKDRIPVNHNFIYNIRERLRKNELMPLAYFLSQDSNFIVSVRTKSGKDTSFVCNYRFQPIEPIQIAKVISGKCAELQDVNESRDFTFKIKNWLFDNQKNPDSLVISRMNNYLKQMYYSKIKEYGMKGKTIPVISKMETQKYKFDVDIEGDYFYLIAVKENNVVRPFVKQKIAEGLSDAKKSTKEAFQCCNQVQHGINTLLLISIDKNWNYRFLPVGMIAVDHIGPIIHSVGHKDDYYLPKSHIHNFYSVIDSILGINEIHKAKDIFFREQNIKINVPKNDIGIDSDISIVNGDITTKDYSHYYCQLMVYYTGDLKYVTIAGQKFNVKQIEESDYIQIRVKDCDDKTIQVVGEDKRGNITKGSVMISPSILRSAMRSAQTQQQYIYQSRSSKSSDSYSDLEYRIEELEEENEELKNRIEELE